MPARSRLAVVVLALSAGSAGADPSRILAFDPVAPRPEEVVAIHVTAPATGCPLRSSSVERAGSLVTVRYEEECACLPGPIVPNEFTEQVGPLPAGRYLVQLEASQAHHDGELCREPTLVAERELLVSGEELALRGGRFLARARWRAFDGSEGAARAVGLTDQSGYFWFFHPTNVELTVKVLDGCPVNGHFWVFVASGSTIEYDIEVTDTLARQTRRYGNGLGEVPRLIADTAAFATCP